MKQLSLALLVLLLSSATIAASSHALIVLRVSKDKRAIEIQRVADQKPTRISVLEKCGNPAVGEPQIRWFEQNSDVLSVGYGKHCSARLVVSSLELTCSGCD